jgi:UDPglucose 6-dehydrogenase
MVPKDRILTTNVCLLNYQNYSKMHFWRNVFSSINAMSELCEKTEADVDEVARAIGADSRIGPKFLKASVGFGGSCFQKDILNLVYIARSYGLNEVADYWEQVIILNDHQKRRFAHNMIQTMYNTVSDKKIVFLGWAFKKDTNDTRESAAIYVADHLLEERAKIHVYDPKVSSKQIQNDLNYLGTRSAEENKIDVIAEADVYEACKGAHAIAILTEWDEFKTFDWNRIYDGMMKPAFVFDGRNLLDKDAMRNLGFQYNGIGR